MYHIVLVSLPWDERRKHRLIGTKWNWIGTDTIKNPFNIWRNGTALYIMGLSDTFGYRLLLAKNIFHLLQVRIQWVNLVNSSTLTLPCKRYITRRISPDDYPFVTAKYTSPLDRYIGRDVFSWVLLITFYKNFSEPQFRLIRSVLTDVFRRIRVICDYWQLLSFM